MLRIPKILEYRRAQHLADNQNLEQNVRQAWQEFQTNIDRTIGLGDGRSTVGLSSRDYQPVGFAIHCARFVDQQSIGTIPMAAAPAVEIGERAPENGENFLNSDFMAFLKNNHVICLNCGRNGAALRSYLGAIFRKGRFQDAAHQFELRRIPNPEKIALIDRLGVKQIDMNVAISDATAVAIQDGRHVGMWAGVKRSAGQMINALTARDEEMSHLRRSEQGTVSVSINVKKGDLEIVREGLNHLAEEIVEDDESDNFTIHLRDGKTTIKASEIAVRKQVRLRTVANTINVDEAWDEMHRYFVDLSDNGMIDI